MTTHNAFEDKLRIREVVENWAVWRDARDWDRFATVWARDGRMMATWTQGSSAEFIEASKQGWDKGVRILHFLGGSSVDVAGDRAIVQTKMTITQRVDVEGVRCDIICTGRFYDFFVREDGDWKVSLRQPIYEIDRLVPLEGGVWPELDAELLASFPEGYRHLAYAQARLGYPIKLTMPLWDGEVSEALYREGASWLAGNPLNWSGE